MSKKCETQTCNNNKAPKRNLCHKCVTRRFKEANPEKYAFFTLRSNCKRRGVVFGLSFKQFLAFAKKTDYMNGKGTGKTGLHIDRIKQEKGYFAGNIQVLTNTENVKKYVQWAQDENGKSTFKTRKKLDLNDGKEDYPF